jgi:peptidoglycan hydrolase-like protein with peptidoglycan-binding domain
MHVKNLRNFLAAHEGEPPRGFAYPGTVKLGDTGPKVRAWQQALNALAKSRLVVDGSFGARTEAAVKAFQTKYHLKVDGVAGPTTWHWLVTMATD